MTDSIYNDCWGCKWPDKHPHDKDCSKSKPLEKTKDNLIEITSEEPESQLERERRAELTLLAVMENILSKHAKKKFCKKHNVPWEEYLLLCDKWKYVLIEARKAATDKHNNTNGVFIADLIDASYNQETCDD